MTAEEYVVNELHEAKEKLHDLNMELNYQTQENEELKDKINELETFIKKVFERMGIHKVTSPGLAPDKPDNFITSSGAIWQDRDKELYDEALTYLKQEEE